MANSTERFGELAALLGKRLEIGLRKLAVGMHHQLDLHAASALREHIKCRHVNVRVNYNQLLLRPPDELDQKRLRIPIPPLIEDALQRRLFRLNEEIDLAFKR